MQQLILGTGTAIWWVTEPYCVTNFIGMTSKTKHRAIMNVCIELSLTEMFVSPKMRAITEAKSSFEDAYNEILELKGKWTE